MSLARNIGYMTKVFRDFSSVDPVKFWDTTQVRPRSVPSKSIPIHYSLSHPVIQRYINLILKALLNNVKKNRTLFNGFYLKLPSVCIINRKIQGFHLKIVIITAQKWFVRNDLFMSFRPVCDSVWIYLICPLQTLRHMCLRQPTGLLNFDTEIIPKHPVEKPILNGDQVSSTLLRRQEATRGCQ
jgi:hypothetical protein